MVVALSGLLVECEVGEIRGDEVQAWLG